MKTIKWIAGIGLATISLTAILLSTASAGDIVYRVTDRHTLTPAQAGGYFADFAAQRCPLAVGKTHQIAVKQIEVVQDGSTDTMYGWVCVSRNSGTLGELVTAMELAKASNLKFRDLGIVGLTNHWSLTRVGAVTPAQAAAYFGGFAADRCRTTSAKVVKIIVTKKYEDPIKYHAECSGIDSDTEAAVQSLRIDASTDASLSVQVLGWVE